MCAEKYNLEVIHQRHNMKYVIIFVNPTHQIQWWSKRWTHDPQVRQCPARGGRIILHTAHLLQFAVRVSLAVWSSAEVSSVDEAADCPMSGVESFLISWLWLCSSCRELVTNPGPLLV